ncbi:MAG: hypothetical protein WBC22_02840 [Sedimentisphaerales bacterium]
MNKKQLIAMWCGIIAIVLMALFPPWAQKTFNRQTGELMMDRRWGHGHRAFFNPPEFKRAENSISSGLPVIDWSRFGVEVGSVILITMSLIYTLKNKKDKKPKDE